MKKWHKIALAISIVAMALWFLRIFKLSGADYHKLAGKGITIPEDYRVNIYQFIYYKSIVAQKPSESQ